MIQGIAKATNIFCNIGPADNDERLLPECVLVFRADLLSDRTRPAPIPPEVRVEGVGGRDHEVELYVVDD